MGVMVELMKEEVIGEMENGLIKGVMFEKKMMVWIMMIVGGLIMIWVDKIKMRKRYNNVMDYKMKICIEIGLIKWIEMIKGV